MKEDLEADEPLQQTTALLQVCRHTPDGNPKPYVVHALRLAPLELAVPYLVKHGILRWHHVR